MVYYLVTIFSRHNSPVYIRRGGVPPHDRPINPLKNRPEVWLFLYRPGSIALRNKLTKNKISCERNAMPYSSLMTGTPDPPGGGPKMAFFAKKMAKTPRENPKPLDPVFSNSRGGAGKLAKMAFFGHFWGFFQFLPFSVKINGFWPKNRVF